MEEFDKDYWEEHWREGARAGAMSSTPPNPYVLALADLTPGTALDAGCGAGAEAIWLAAQGWEVTGTDVSAEALAAAAERASEAGVGIDWVEADATTWEPPVPLDLVVTSYAHPATPQLDFYVRLASWVAPGGTLLIVGHRDAGDTGATHGRGHGHGHGHGDDVREGHDFPAASKVTVEAITARLDPAAWEIVTASEPDRTVVWSGEELTLQDVVVRAVRRGY